MITPFPQLTRFSWCARALAALTILVASGCDSVTAPTTEPPPVQNPLIGLSLAGTELIYSTINDGAVQAGENVQFDLFFTNTSTAAYTGVSASITTRSPTIRTLDAFNYSQRVEPGQAARISVAFTVNPDVPSGTEIPFTLRLGTGAVAPNMFDFTITTGALPHSWSANSISVSDDTDGDGRVEPGEEAVLRFTSRPEGTQSEFSSCSQYRVTSPMAQVSFAGANSGSCASGREQTVRFRASSTLTVGTALPFVIRLSDGLGNTWDTPVSVPLQ